MRNLVLNFQNIRGIKKKIYEFLIQNNLKIVMIFVKILTLNLSKILLMCIFEIFYWYMKKL